MDKGVKNLKQWQIDILVKWCLFKKRCGGYTGSMDRIKDGREVNYIEVKIK